jgi:hypothetical protein
MTNDPAYSARLLQKKKRSDDEAIITEQNKSKATKGGQTRHANFNIKTYVSLGSIPRYMSLRKMLVLRQF